MSNSNKIPVYVVKKGYIYDECEDSCIGSFLSLSEAERELYYQTILLAMNVKGEIKQEEWDKRRFYIDDYYAYIEIKYIDINYQMGCK